MSGRVRRTVRSLLIGVVASTMVAVAAPAAADFGYLSHLGIAGAGQGQFFNTEGVAVGPDGNLYVADAGNDRVEVVTPAGAFVRAWGTHGQGQGQFESLWGIAVGGSGDVYTAESTFGSPGNDRIQVFHPDGTFVTGWGDVGSLAGSPMGIAVDAADDVYVAAFNSKVLKFDSTGHLLKQWGAPGFAAGQFRGLAAIAVDTAGNVYTAEDLPTNSNYRVQKFESDGSPKADFLDAVGNPTSIIPLATSPGDWPGARGIAVDAAGYIYTFNAGVARFAATGASTDHVVCNQQSMTGLAAHPNGKIYASDGTGVLTFGAGGTTCGGSAPEQLVFSGTEGVTMNAGALYTNSPDVKLTIVPPGGASHVLLANDGSFAQPIATGACVGPATCKHAIVPAGVYDWTLQPAADERLPKTVYVRFANASMTSATTFTDDIILDTVAPITSSATIAPVSAAGSAVVAHAQAATTATRYVLRVKASDNASGVGQLQTATDTTKPSPPIAYSSAVALTTSTPPSYVRAIDRAGNRSAWHKIGTPALVTGLTQSRSTWRTGTVFSFRLNMAAKVTLAFARITPGRRAGGRCVKQTTQNKRYPACTRSTPKGALTRRARKGVNHVTFTGRLTPTSTLAPGRYALTITAINGIGQRTTSKTLIFTITA